MHRAAGTSAFAVAVLLVAVVVADDAADWRRCERASAEPLAGIAACMRLIEGGKQTPVDLVLAHYNCGNVYAV